MAMSELEIAVDNAGLTNAFKVVDLDSFSEFIEKEALDEAVSTGCFQKLLRGLIIYGTFPASWQKLSDLGWADDEVSCLVDNQLIDESPTTLVAAISSGALSIQEYDEFANYPNQEINVFYLSPKARKVVAWLNEKLTLPKISEDAFV